MKRRKQESGMDGWRGGERGRCSLRANKTLKQDASRILRDIDIIVKVLHCLEFRIFSADRIREFRFVNSFKGPFFNIFGLRNLLHKGKGTAAFIQHIYNKMKYNFLVL